MNKRFSFLLFLFLFSVFTYPNVLFGAGGLFDLLETISGRGEDKGPKFRVTWVEGDQDAEDEVLLIKIKGIIRDTDDSEGMPFEIRKNMIENIKKDLDVAKNRSEIKAILLEIDSPGGEVTASDILHHQIMKVKETKKPVIALIGMLGASGGYYVACAADHIMAHPTSILGSIGVLMHTANLQKLADMVGYKDVTLKSERTPKKDIMSPFRTMTDDEKALLLSVIDSIYDRFVQVVAQGRKKNPEEIIPLADGSIYTSDQALKKGLIDGIGYREDAMDKIKALISSKNVKLVKRRTKKSLAEMFSEMSEMNSGIPTFLSGMQQLLDDSNTPRILFQMRTK